MTERTALRLGGICGVLSIALMFTRLLISSIGAPGPEAMPDQVLDYLTARNGSIELGNFLLMPLAAFLILWFLGAVRVLLPGAALLTTVALISGPLFVGVYLVASVMSALPTAALDFYSDGFRDPQAISGYLGLSVGYDLTAAAGPVAAAMIIATTLAMRQAGLVPRWVAVAGWVLAAIALTAGLSGFGFPPFGIWVVVMSAVMLMRSRTRQRPLDHAVSDDAAATSE